jgi:hypothetical protein
MKLRGGEGESVDSVGCCPVFGRFENVTKQTPVCLWVDANGIDSGFHDVPDLPLFWCCCAVVAPGVAWSILGGLKHFFDVLGCGCRLHRVGSCFVLEVT